MAVNCCSILSSLVLLPKRLASALRLPPRAVKLLRIVGCGPFYYYLIVICACTGSGCFRRLMLYCRLFAGRFRAGLHGIAFFIFSLALPHGCNVNVIVYTPSVLLLHFKYRLHCLTEQDL